MVKRFKKRMPEMNTTAETNNSNNPTEKVAVKRILFADAAATKFGLVQNTLKNENWICEMATEPNQFLQMIKDNHYDVAVVNLLLGGAGPFEMITQVRTSSKNKTIKIMVVSRQVHKTNIQNTIKAGADDFVAEPFEAPSLHRRILYHVSGTQTVRNVDTNPIILGKNNQDMVFLMLEATELYSMNEREHQHKVLMTVLEKLSALLESNRTSLILTDYKANAGVVLASSDDAKFKDFPISLDKYPEILHVLNTGQVVLVSDVSQNALTNSINQSVKTIQIGSLMVFPVRFQGEVFGALTIRRPKAAHLPPSDVMRLVQGLANVLGAQANVEASLRKIYKDFPKKVA